MERITDQHFIGQFVNCHAFAAANNDKFTLRRNYHAGNFVLSIRLNEVDNELVHFLGFAEGDWCNYIIDQGVNLLEEDQYYVEELQQFAKLVEAGEANDNFLSFFREYSCYKTVEAFFAEGVCVAA
jgi:hypothetical protein